MGASRLAHQSEIGELRTQEVLKQPEGRENQEGTIRASKSAQKQGSGIVLLKDRITDP